MSMDVNLSSTLPDFSSRSEASFCCVSSSVKVVPENAVKVQAGDDAADAVWCEVNLQGINTEERKNGFKCCGGTTSDSEKRMEYHYKLHVKNASRGLDTEAEVMQTIRGNLVREEHFQVEKAGEIAVDHSAIIVQALLTLKKRL